LVGLRLEMCDVKYTETCDPYGLPYIVHECPSKPFNKARHDVPSGGESKGSKAQPLYAALMPFPTLMGLCQGSISSLLLDFIFIPRSIKTSIFAWSRY
jgi:hypothetical protein